MTMRNGNHGVHGVQTGHVTRRVSPSVLGQGMIVKTSVPEKPSTAVTSKIPHFLEDDFKQPNWGRRRDLC